MEQLKFEVRKKKKVSYSEVPSKFSLSMECEDAFRSLEGGSVAETAFVILHDKFSSCRFFTRLLFK